MKICEFPYYVSFGPGDSADNSIDVELTDAEYDRLVKSSEENCRFHLYEDDSLHDIYKKVEELAILQEMDCLRADPSYMCEQVGEYLELDEGEAETHDYTDEELTNYLTAYLTITINYPSELQG